jgi:hypothetical protein
MDNESSMLANASSGFYLRERKTDHRCEPAADRDLTAYLP